MDQTTPAITTMWNTLKVFPLLACMMSSCTDGDDKRNAQATNGKLPSEVVEIKQALSGKTISMLDMGRTMVKPEYARIYNHISAVNKYKDPDWDSFNTYKDTDGSEIFVFRLESEEPYSCYSVWMEGGKMQVRIGNAVSRLAIRKVSEEYMARVLTYVSAAKMSQEMVASSDWGFEPPGRSFNGMRLVSTLDGILLFGDIYKDGKAEYNFMPSSHAHKRDSIQCKQAIGSLENIPRRHILFRLFGKSSNFASRLSCNTEGNAICIICGKRDANCDCGLVVTPSGSNVQYCSTCNLRKEFCISSLKSPDCHQHPCICYSGGYLGGNNGSGSGSRGRDGYFFLGRGQ